MTKKQMVNRRVWFNGDTHYSLICNDLDFFLAVTEKNKNSIVFTIPIEDMLIKYPHLHLSYDLINYNLEQLNVFVEFFKNKKDEYK